MRIRFLTLIVALAAGALALTVVTSGQAGTGNIFGSGHDVGSAGNPTCAQCHTPHKAGGNYLWATTPSTSLPGLGGLCFSCHDGTVAYPSIPGQWIPGNESHKVKPNVQGEDCDLCHDPHEGGNWKFVDNPAITVGYQNANLCSACHSGDVGAVTHDVDVLTNLPINRDWDPTSSDFVGTRLWNAAGTAEVASGDGEIKCGTCHVVHGASENKLTSMAYTDPGSSHSPICENCHY